MTDLVPFTWYSYILLYIEIIKSSQTRHLRSRRGLSLFKDVPLRIRRALLLYKVYGDSTLLVLNGTYLNTDSALLALNWQHSHWSWIAPDAVWSKAVVKRLTEPKPKSKPVFNLKPCLDFSSRWSRNNVEDFKNMGKTHDDQHQIDKNHYCSVTFSKP